MTNYRKHLTGGKIEKLMAATKASRQGPAPLTFFKLKADR
jgi:hypothetical protein